MSTLFSLRPSSSWRGALTTSLTLLLSFSSSPAAVLAQTSSSCNGSPDLCSRSYANVTHMGAHNAAFLRDESTNNSLAGNQFFNATRALNDGLRLLQSQVHLVDGTLRLCHSSCSLLDAGTLSNWLSSVNDWMDDSPDEVVTLLFVNANDADPSDFASAFESSSIDKHAYAPSSGPSGPHSSPWPTLQELIDADTRLVTFITNADPSEEYPYLLPQFEHVWETHFQVTSPSGFNCTLDRPSTSSSADEALSAGLMPLMNHFMYESLGVADVLVPAARSINDTNSPREGDGAPEGGLGRHAIRCREEWGRAPTFVLVDFYDRGPAVDVAHSMNGVEAGEGGGSGDSDGEDGDGRGQNGGSGNGEGENAATSAFGRGIETGGLIAFLGAALVLL